MFMDGMLYVSVSKNLADGLGTFWEPHLSPVFWPIFREQPPLYFGLLALFFKTFGSSIYVERLFCFLCLTITLFFIHKIWRVLNIGDKSHEKNSWLPILFFITIPVVFWAYANHVEETLMTLFVVMSIYFLSKAFFNDEKKFLNIVFAGVCIFLSSLTKGIQGLFPIAAVFFYWLVNNSKMSFLQMLKYSAILILTPAMIYVCIIVANPKVIDIYKAYFENRLGKAFLTGEHHTTNNHFEIGIRLITELIPMYILMFFIFLVGKKYSNQKINSDSKTKIYWLICIGLSGSLPLMSTLEQRGFYLVTSLPFFALAASLLVYSYLSGWINSIDISGKIFRVLKYTTVVLLMVSIVFTFSQIGKYKRDKEMLTDIHSFVKIIPRGEIVAIPNEMGWDYNMIEYFIRYGYISCGSKVGLTEFYIIKKDLPKSLVPMEYEPYPVSTEALDLYVLKK